jgi:hypothetical protein
MMDGAYADNAYGRYRLGAWTYKRAIETADSGGRLMALLDPPSPVRMLMADPACADSITVSWNPPMDFGTVATMDENGVYVGPDYIGGRRAGKEEVGEDATSVTYHIQRMVDGGAWNMGMYVNATLYMDDDVEYGSVYKYRVRAKNGANLYSDWMMVREDLTEPAQPLRPGSPVAKHETNEMGQPIIALNWDAPDDSETQLWRSVSDIGAGNMSKSLSYRIERKIDDGMWVVLARAKAHEYIPGETPQSAILHFHKQKLIDDSADAIRAAAEGQSVKYRVSALVHACNQSDWISVDEVSGSPDLSLGDASSLSAASAAAGMVQLTWTSGNNSNVHWVAGIGVNADGSYDQSRTVWAQASSGNSHTVTGLAAGQYLFAVIAGESTNGPWSNWTMSNQVTVN